MNRVVTMIYGMISYLLIAGAVSPAWADDNFTQADRERLVRLEATLTVFMQQVDKRFEQVDKRFEQTTNMFYTISAIFTSLFTAVFGYAWWDRRTVLINARKAAREELEGSTQAIRENRVTLDQLVDVLRKFAEKTPDLKELMSRAHLL